MERAGSRGGGAREREGVGQGHGENRLLTLMPLEVTAVAGEARSAGELWWPELQTTPDWRGRGLSGGSRLVEEVEGVEAELPGSSVELGAAQNGGDGWARGG